MFRGEVNMEFRGQLTCKGAFFGLDGVGDWVMM
jgi:hypothetical protein